MLHKNLTAKELYASIPNTVFVKEMFNKGLKMGSTQLAISAMEELLRRGNTDMIWEELKNAFDKGYVKLGTSMSVMIASSLSESCRDIDPLLQRFGKFLFKAKTDDPFTEMLEDPDFNRPQDIESLTSKTSFIEPTVTNSFRSLYAAKYNGNASSTEVFKKWLDRNQDDGK